MAVWLIVLLIVVLAFVAGGVGLVLYLKAAARGNN